MGLKQLQYIHKIFCIEASNTFPNRRPDLGEHIVFDGSLIDVVPSMAWADCRKNSKKDKILPGFNIKKRIPSKIYFTNGNGAERPSFSQILSPDQTGVSDCGYQKHAGFDSLQAEGKSFVIRIKADTIKTLIHK
ncbi:MAG: hypothetical protein KKC46_16710 [Proteobacteria bacterium]|nr:hypothetical protein [Pseudomonadota bacterium]